MTEQGQLPSEEKSHRDAVEHAFAELMAVGGLQTVDQLEQAHQMILDMEAGDRLRRMEAYEVARGNLEAHERIRAHRG